MNKKIIKHLGLLTILLISFSSFAQKNEQCKHHREQIKAKRVAYITKSLKLTVDEAQKFWPIYNDYNSKVEKLRDKKHSEIYKNNETDYSEKEYQVFIDKRIEFLEKETKLKKDYQNDLSKIFTAKQIFLLYKSERDFKREMIKNFREHKPACKQ